jgi:hypothetical protein
MLASEDLVTHLELLTYFRMCPLPISGVTPTTLIEVSSWFPTVSIANSWMLLQLSSLPLPSTSTANHYSSVILSFDVIHFG